MDKTKNVQKITKDRPSFWKTTLAAIFSKKNSKRTTKHISQSRNTFRSDKNK